MHLGLSAPQDCQRKTFILLCLLEVDLGTELLQGSSLRRGAGRGFPQGECAVAPLCWGEVKWGCLYSSEKSIPGHVQNYGYSQLCNNVWLFSGEKIFFAMSPKTPCTGLSQRI